MTTGQNSPSNPGRRERSSRRETAPAAGQSELLQHAARCYQQAGWDRDAARLFAGLSDFHASARILERLGEFEHAAESFERCQEWSEAARCRERAGQFHQAADCWFHAGRLLESAWLWARYDQTDRAREMLEKFSPDPDAEWHPVALTIIRTQCRLLEGDVNSELIEDLRDAVATLRDFPAIAARQDWGVRACEVAAALGRPDLIGELHGMSVASNLFSAIDNWRDWTRKEFNALVPPPLPPQEKADAPIPEE